MGATYKKYWLVNHDSCPEFSAYSEDDLALLIGCITQWNLEPENPLDSWKTEFIIRHLYTLKEGKEELVHGVRVIAVHLLTEPLI
jgi:hypothetical protein